MTMSLGTVRAYHAPSGSVVVGEVTKQNVDGDVCIIPEGMLEQVVLRQGVWHIAWTDEKASYPFSGKRIEP